MTDRAPATPAPGLLLLCAALGALYPLVARGLAARLDDAQLLGGACALGFAFALGSAAVAFVPSWQAEPRARRLRARAGWASAASLLPCAALAYALLGMSSALATLVMALPLAAAGCALAADLCLAQRGVRFVPVAWFAAAGIGMAAALPGLGGAVALPNGGGAQPFAARAAAFGLRAEPRGEAWDALGGMQRLEVLSKSGAATGASVLLRDGAPDAPLLRPDDPLVRAACGARVLRLPLMQKQQRVLIAGLAGGTGLQCALLGHATHVDAAEPSAARERLIRGAAGAALDDARVHRYRAAPRAFVARADARGYDVIALETARGRHTAPPGLLPLPLDTLRTDRGVAALIAALAPHGVLWATARGEPQALRLAGTAKAALGQLGAAAPDAHIAVHGMGDVYAITVGRSPLGINQVLAMHDSDRDAARGAAQEPPLATLIGLPGAPRLLFTAGAAFQNRFRWLLASDGERLRAEYAFDLSVPTDDRPLFDEQTRRDRPDTWSDATPYAVLLQLLWIATPCAGLLLLAVGVRARPPRAAGVAFSFVQLGAAQALAYAYLNHAIALHVARPEHGLALAALALPLLASVGALFPRAREARPFALTAQILGATIAGPLASWLVLADGYIAVARPVVILVVLAAVAAMRGYRLARD